METYPESLPAPLVGTEYRPIDPQMRTQMESGRARVRRRFTAVPVNFSSRFIMSDEQAREFEAFYSGTLKDGVNWFLMPILSPYGRKLERVRFVGIYQGPSLLTMPTEKGRRWAYSADFEIYLRPKNE